MTLRLPAALQQQIRSAALLAFPRECCGLLIGAGEHVTRIVAAANLDPAPDRFELDPAVHLRVQRELRGTAERVIGHYHSHPNGLAEPSAVDLAAAAHDPRMLWLIAGCDGRMLRVGWRGGGECDADLGGGPSRSRAGPVRA